MTVGVRMLREPLVQLKARKNSRLRVGVLHATELQNNKVN